MKKPGLPLSTIALVGIMVGALYMVSKQVTPPPALPPAEPITQASATVDDHKHDAAPPQKEPTAEERKKQMEAQAREMKKHYAQEKKEQDARQEAAHKAMEASNEKAKLKGQDITRYDPAGTTIDGKYFGAMPMGQEGIEETDKAIAVIEAAKVKAEREAAAKGQTRATAAKPKGVAQ